MSVHGWGLPRACSTKRVEAIGAIPSSTWSSHLRSRLVEQTQAAPHQVSKHAQTYAYQDDLNMVATAEANGLATAAFTAECQMFCSEQMR